MRSPVVVAVVVVLLGIGPAPAARWGTSPSGRVLVVGAAEDAVRSSNSSTARRQMSLLVAGGFGAVRVTTVWKPGARSLSGDELRILRTVEATARAAGVRVLVSVMAAGSATTPRTVEAQQQFASYAASVVTSLPCRR